jgi:hypothetical protein
MKRPIALAVFIAATLFAAFLFAIYANSDSRADAASDEIGKSDPLYRSIYAGLFAPASSGGETGSAIAGALSRYLKRSDIVARGTPQVRQHGSSWSLFGGPQRAFWEERTQWCLKLRYRDGEQTMFVDALFPIAQLDTKHALGLPERNNRPTAQELKEMMAKYGGGVLLPVEYVRSGESESKVDTRVWRLVTDSGVCAKKP